MVLGEHSSMTEPPFCTVRVMLSVSDVVAYAPSTQPKNSEEEREIIHNINTHVYYISACSVGA